MRVLGGLLFHSPTPSSEGIQCRHVGDPLGVPVLGPGTIPPEGSGVFHSAGSIEFSSGLEINYYIMYITSSSKTFIKKINKYLGFLGVFFIIKDMVTRSRILPLLRHFRDNVAKRE